MSSGGTRLAGHPAKYQFGEFELFPNQGALWRAGVRVPLMPKPLATLLVLVDRAGETVSKDDLLAEVWNGMAVEENNLTQSISSLRKALGEKRGENRFIATEPGNGYRFVAAVTGVEDPPFAISDAIISSETITHEPEPVRRSRVPLYLAAVGLLVLIFIFGALLWTRGSTAKIIRRKSIAVLNIRDLSKADSEVWLQTALSEMLTSELASSGKLHAIPAEDVARWRSDLGTTPERARQADLLRLAHNSFGADTFVLGSYVVTGTCPECRVRVDLGLFDAGTGDQIATIIDEGPAQYLLDLTARLGGKLRSELGVGGTPAVQARWPAPSAMKEYAEGLKALRLMDPMAARDHLQAAVNADPGNAFIHSALSDAWNALGYGSRAIEESKRAFELSTSLGRLDQLGIEARYRASSQQWNRAIEIYGDIFRLFPDSLEDGLNLAKAQSRARKFADSLATLLILRRLPPPAGNDPWIDLLEAQIAGSSNDYPKTREYAHRAAMEAQSRGARYLFARARLLEGGAMQNLHDANFYVVQTEARKVCEELGDRQCISQAWRIHGNYLYFSGQFAEAQQSYLAGLSVARELGDHGEQANLLTGLAVVAESNFEWPQAEQSLQEAISLKKEISYNPSQIQIELVELYLRLGRLQDAARAADEAYSEAQKNNAHEDLGVLFQMRGTLARLEGRLDIAREMDEKGVAELRVSKGSFSLTLALAALSSTLTARGELGTAEKRLAETVASSAPEASGSVELARAELLLAQGQFQKAEQQAQRAAADFNTTHLDEKLAEALVTEADALQMLGRNADALALCQEAGRRAARIPNPVPILSARLAVWSLTGDTDSSVPTDLHAKVVSLKNPELSLEENFDRAMRAKRIGAPNAKSLFDALAGQAASQGYLTLSRRAHSLAQ
jgi:DNA-binding winged helix-turn-helix (wHTH) protein/tetratricopeptide (TPR) repeat protein/TolB-like protein